MTEPDLRIQKKLEEAVRAEQAAAEAAEAAKQSLAESVELAREAGWQWARIAKVVGLTESALLFRLKGKDWPSTKRPPKPRKSLKGAKYKTRGPGMSVADWAAQEGVTKVTVYRQIEQGRLVTAENDLGHVRIIGRK